MSESFKEHLLELINNRFANMPSEIEQNELTSFMDDFSILAGEIKSSVPDERYVKVQNIEYRNIKASVISITGDVLYLNYLAEDEAIAISYGTEDDKTIVDFLRVKDGGIISGRTGKTVTTDDVLRYFEKTDMYKNLLITNKLK